MKTPLRFFFRHPNPIYFSLEKIFRTVMTEINRLSMDFEASEEVLPLPSKISSLRANIRFVRQRQTRINHITGDTQYAILGCSRKNINVLTIHDCVLLHHYPPSSLKHQIIRLLWYRLPVRRADAVTVISEATRRELIGFTGCAPEKIHLVPNFLDPLYLPVQAHPFPLRAKLLFIGTAPNKNLRRVIEAVEDLEVELLIIGYPDPELLEYMDKKKIIYSCRTKLSPEAMRETYAECDMLVFPSLLEGFGLPILEAQATGRPVLTSEREPMRPVAGNGACFVDPLSSASIREGIQRIINDGSYRLSLVSAGFENVKRFGVTEVVNRYLELYKILLDQKPGKVSGPVTKNNQE